MPLSERVSTAISVLSLVVSICALSYTIRSDAQKDRNTAASFNRNAFMLGYGSSVMYGEQIKINSGKKRGEDAALLEAFEAANKQLLLPNRLYYDLLVLAPESWQADDASALVHNSSRQISARYGGDVHKYFELGMHLGMLISYYNLALAPEPIVEPTERIRAMQKQLQLAQSIAAELGISSGRDTLIQQSADEMLARANALRLSAKAAVGYVDLGK